MTEETPLDRAHLAAEADESLRPRFWDRLLDAELFLVLEEEPEGATVRPVILETSDGRVALAFDREGRMADFMEGMTPFAALSGRRLVGLLAGQGVGLALNLGGHGSETILPVEALRWAADQLADLTEVRESALRDIRKPAGLPEALLNAIHEKLPGLEGLAAEAWLVGVSYRDGQQGHLLAVLDALPPAQEAIATAMAEALRLSGLDAGALDIAFFDRGAKVAETIRRHGLGFEIPQPAVEIREVSAPGSDPSKPPILR